MMTLIPNPKMPPHENEIEIADRNSFWWFSGRERGEREGGKKREREREMERERAKEKERERERERERKREREREK